MLNLCTVLAHTARCDPQRTALVAGDREYSYGELDRAAIAVARHLVSRGVEPGDRVAMMIPNVAEFPMIYYGILRAGAVVVPLNVMLKREEVAYHLRDSQARAFFCALPGIDPDAWRGYQDVGSCHLLMTLGTGPDIDVQHARLEDVVAEAPTADENSPEILVPRAPDDTAVVLYTSGTTGKPKGAQITHANLLVSSLVLNDMLDTRATDVHLVSLPLFHAFGQVLQMNAGFAAGASLVLLARFSPAEAIRLMQCHRVTVFAGVPTMYWALLAEADQFEGDVDLGSLLRLAVSGGAALTVDVLERFRKVFGVAIREGYGLSEACPAVTFNPLDRPTKPGSIGLPICGMEVKLADADGHDIRGAGIAGELLTRGHNVMKGYLGRPEATAEAFRDGWLRTGDIATRDEDGYYYIVDRAKDLIVRSGFNVYPRQVEETLQAHPEVSLVSVVGVPDERTGEEVKAFVIRQSGSSLTEEELIAWSRARLATYKCPRLVEFRDSLPMTATGKILKRELV